MAKGKASVKKSTPRQKIAPAKKGAKKKKGTAKSINKPVSKRVQPGSGGKPQTRSDLLVEIKKLRSKITRQEKALSKKAPTLGDAPKTEKLIHSIALAQSRFIENREPSIIFKDLLYDFMKLTNSEYGFIGELVEDDKGDECPKLFVCMNVADKKRRNLSAEKNMGVKAEFFNLNIFSEELIKTGQSVISNEPSKDLRISVKPKKKLALNSFMGLPIVDGNFLQGMLCVANRRGGYDDELAESFQPFLDACSSIITGIREKAEKKEAEDGLKKAKREIENIIEASPELHCVVDKDGALIKWNEGFEKLTGYRKNKLMFRPFADFVLANDRCELAKRIGEVFKKGESAAQISFISHDRSPVLYQFHGRIFKNKNGNVMAFTGVARDISRRKLSETMLKRSNDQLQAIIDNSTASIYLKDTECRYIMVNRRYEELFNMKEENVIGKTEYDFYPKELADLYRANDMRVIETNLPYESEEVVKLEDGYHTYIASKFPLTDSSGKPYAVGCISTDITPRKKAEEKLQLASKVVEYASEGVIATDLSAIIRSANPAFCKMSGYTEKELIGQNAKILKSGRHNTKFYKQFWHDLIEKGFWKGEVFNKRKNGEVYPQEISINGIRNDEGKIIQYVAIYDDISDRKKAEEDILLASKVFETASEGVLVTDTNTVIQYVNRAFNDITGYESKEVIGRKPDILQSKKHDKGFYKKMWGKLLKTGRWKGEIWNRRKNGDLYLQKMTITAIKDSSGITTQYASVFHDITELRRGEEEIKYQAYHDILTGLPNRALFKDRLKQSIVRMQRNNRGLALLFVDIDNFKRINDTFGHLAGDLLLQGMAMRLVACLREADTISRFAGDEFTVIIENLTNEQDVVVLARKIIETLSDPFIFRGKKVSTTVSVGIAIYPSDGTSVDELLKSADLAMYHVKDRTKNNYQFFDKTMNERFIKRIEMEQKLQKAIENNEFVVYYQPKVQIVSAAITGLEALVRWKRPDGEIVPPGLFIPLAEETALIVPIGEIVLKQACIQLKKWHDNGHPDLTMAVNVSARQFDRENLLEVVSSVISDTGLDPRYLRLEVTESAMMKDINTTLTTLDKLIKMGIKISMDDFGTGYSSLGNLRKFPIDELKIDRFFICSIPEDKDDSAIVATIISMAHYLKLSVVAEGVETKDQLEFLRTSGCGEIQGYYISPPIPSDKMTRLLDEKEEVIAKLR